MAATAHAKSWLKRYFDDKNFPEWTKTNLGITTPLSFPEREKLPMGHEQETFCLLCEKIFSLPKNGEELLKHLVDQHHFVIGEVNLIADLPSYINYWKNKFQDESFVDFVHTMRSPVTKEDGSKEEVDFYFLNDSNSEDRELRMQLQMKRLENVLEVQENERKLTNFNRSCLFCRSEFSKVKNLFDHMAFDHNFSVGQSDNLVFVNELLDVLEKKLEDMTCIFCEKVFKSREVLKEHMRKKSHKKINPKNLSYDKFYLVNYLEFGKTWEEVNSETLFDDEFLPSGFDSDNDNDNDWSDWKGDLSGVVCLFCEAIYNDIKDLLVHMDLIHQFNFKKLRDESELSFYQQVKLINYIRRQVHLNSCICCGEKFEDREKLIFHMGSEEHMRLPETNEDWDQSQYFFPTYENDNFLCGLDEVDDPKSMGENEEDGSADLPLVIGEDFPVTESILSEEEFRRSLLPNKVKPKGNKESK